MVNVKFRNGTSFQQLRDLIGGKSRTDALRSLRKTLFLSSNISELLFFMLDKINEILIQVQATDSQEKKYELLKLNDDLENTMKLVEAVVINNISSGKNITSQMITHFKYLIEKLMARKLS